MGKRESFETAKNCMEADTARNTAKPLTEKEVEKQLRSGKLTENQAIELRQRYMDNLEYKEGQRVKTG